MTLEIGLLLLLIAGAIGLFAAEIFPVDKVSLLLLAALAVLGLVTPEQALAGFGHPATITVACMLALSFGIEQTGGLRFLADKMARLARGSELRVLICLILATGGLSAFINNTAAVAIFLPICLALARDWGLQPSKLLMPMSFASIFGGTCTLIGTSTNLIVYGLVRSQLGHTIGMFDITALGLIFFVSGSAYLLLFGRHFIQSRRSADDLTKVYRLRNFTTELILKDDSPLVGKTLKEARLAEEHNLHTMEVWRGKAKLLATETERVLQPGDMLLVQGTPESLLGISRKLGVRLRPLKLEDQDLESERIVLVEAIVAPMSQLIGKTLKEMNFRRTYKANALALRSHGRTIRERIGTTPIQAADCLLILTSREQLAVLRNLPDFLILKELPPLLKTNKALTALAIFLGVILSAATGLLDIAVAALAGVSLMLLAGCFRLRDLYVNLSWTTLIMLGCLIPLGTAISQTGAAALLAQMVVSSLQSLGPFAVLAGIYVLTSLMTEILSNNASAVLMIPISIAVAAEMAVSPMPFIFGVMFAASASFMTPIGYQTNTMVFTPGGYRFSDFLKVGGPLNLLFAIIATIFIPYFWPF